jgi:hypothetical protein
VPRTSTLLARLTRLVAQDASKRIELDGSPVPANALVVLHHSATSEALCSEPRCAYPNDFGSEFEVSAHTQTATGSKRTITAEVAGERSAEDLVRQEGVVNQWALLTAPALAEGKE